MELSVKVAYDRGLLDNILPNTNFTFNMSLVHTGCNEELTSRDSLRMIRGVGMQEGRLYSSTLELDPVIAISGCLCDGPTKIATDMARPFKIPVLSPSATAVELSDKSKYPYFARTVPSSMSEVTLVAELIIKFGWKRVVQIVVTNDRSTAANEALAERVRVADPKVDMIKMVVGHDISNLRLDNKHLYNYSKVREFAAKVARIKPEPRIFTGIMGTFNVVPILRAMVESGLVGSKRFWILEDSLCRTDFFISKDLTDNNSWELNNLEGHRAGDFDWHFLSDHFKGCMCGSASIVGPYLNEMWMPFWTSLTAADIHRAGYVPPEGPVENSAFAEGGKLFLSKNMYALRVDGMMAFLVAVGNLLNQGVAPADIRGDVLKKAIFDAKFEGITGPVGFTETGDRLSSFDIKSFQPNATLGHVYLKTVGKYDSTTANLTMTPSAHVFADGSLDVPRDRPIDCPKGSEYVGLKDEDCQLCPPGKRGQILPLLGPSCIDCGTGLFADKHGQVACNVTPPGYMTSTVQAIKPEPCPSGSYSNTAGSSECTACSPGTFSNRAILQGDQEGASECSLCPKGKYLNHVGGSLCYDCEAVMTGSTTIAVGSRSNTSCMCRDDFFRASDGTCWPCVVGLRCDWRSYAPKGTTEESMDVVVKDATDDQMSPSISPGFYYKRDKVYSCRPQHACEGGAWAKENLCQGGRSGFLCQDCPSGSYPSSSGCTGCRPGDTIGKAVLALLLLVVCCGMLIAANARALTQNALGMTMTLVSGQILTTLQIIAAFNSTSIQWGKPFTDVIEVLKLLSFDFDLIRIQCGGLTDPLAKYAFKMSMPILSAAILCSFHCLVNTIRPGLSSINGLINAVGQMMFIFFISLGISVMSPFQCYNHPAGNGFSSLVVSPQVLCGSGDHSVLQVVAIVSVVFYIGLFLTVTGYAVIWYPTLIVSDNINFMKRFRFLFIRWDPRVHWFSLPLLAKNFLVALYPMLLPEANLDLTIVLLLLTLAGYLFLAARFEPWRTPELNWLDWISTGSLCIILLIGSMTVGGEEPSAGASITLTVIFSMLMLVMALFFCYYAYRRLLEIMNIKKRYAVFVSHHKGGGACCARFLKMALSKRVTGTIFFDGDNLDSFSGIFDAVKMSETMLIVLSGETLSRPWCVGEIVTAYYNRIPTKTCIMADGQSESLAKWTQLTAEGFANFYGKFEVLRPYGIALEDIKPAIDLMLQDAPIRIDLGNCAALDESLQEAVVALASRSDEIKVTRASRRMTKMLSSGTTDVMGKNLDAPVLLLSDETDPEASASARVLKMLLQEMAQQQVQLDLALDESEYSAMLSGTGAVSTFCTFTSTTLQNPRQLARIAMYFKMRPAGILVPVLIGETFQFPSASFFEDLVQKGHPFGSVQGATDLFSRAAGSLITPVEVKEALEWTFETTAEFVNVPYANEDLLVVQVAKLSSKYAPKKVRRASRRRSSLWAEQPVGFGLGSGLEDRAGEHQALENAPAPPRQEPNGSTHGELLPPKDAEEMEGTGQHRGHAQGTLLGARTCALQETEGKNGKTETVNV